MNTASWLQGIRTRERWRVLVTTRGPGLVVGIVAVALAAQLAVLVTGLTGGGASPAPLAVWHPHARAPDVADIVASHLFGRAPEAPGRLDPNAPQTRLPLVLTGVMAANDPSKGLAILGPNPQTAKVYAVGDSVPGGAKLDAVLPRKVLLRSNGEVQSLPLPRQSVAHAAPPSAALPASETRAPQFVARMRALVQRRPGLLSRLLRPEPVFAGGQLRGYRVYPGSDPAAFRRLGLKSGDLVMDINGTPLTDPAQDQQILNTLGTSSEATVTVLRNGASHVLTLNLAQVEQAAQSVTSQAATPHKHTSPSPVPFGAEHAPRRPPR